MPVTDSYEVHLRDYLYILRKRRFAIVGFFLMMVLGSVVLTFMEQVLYRAVSTILIERENPNVVDFKEVMAIDTSMTEYYQTQFQMLKSQSLIHRLLEQEKMANDPYFQSLQKKGLRGWIRTQPALASTMGNLAAELDAEDLFVKRMLKVTPMRNSRLVEVSVIHPDPERATSLTNSLIELYIRRNLEDRFSVSKQATELISNQLIELKEKVQGAEDALQQYKEERGLVKLPSMTSRNQFIEEAKLELVKIQAEESKLSKRYLPEHPKRIHIQSQIEGLEEKIREEEDEILNLGRDALGYQQLEREAESTRKIYQSLLKRLEETRTEAEAQASNIMIVDKAETPQRAYRPNPVSNLSIGIFLGMIGGILLAFFMEYFDSTIKIPDDVEKGLGLNLFGIVPDEDNKAMKGKVFFEADEHLPAAESVRALRTALLFKLRKVPGCRVILVTSPNPGEGKSTLALNLATAFHHNHLKAVIIDADLRKPTLHKKLELPAENGLTEVLEGTIPLEQGIRKSLPGLGLDFISCGVRSSHPAEILGTKAMKTLIENLKQEYDIIVLDSPPYLPVADVAVLSEYADAVVIVARHHVTEKRQLRDVKKRFSDSNIKELGVVINRVSVREKDYYYQQYYYYGYGDSKPKK
jgi:succinoglycan biosynthesis transport protein ExoP